MFGYATDETEECMPLTVVLAHRLNQLIADLRRDGTFPWARPDSKTQVSFATSTSTPSQLSWCLQNHSNICWFTVIATFLNFWTLVCWHFRLVRKYFADFFFSRCQVTAEYIFQNGACIPQRVHTVVVSVQHSEKISLEELRSEILEKVVKVVIPEQYLDDKTIVHINPCGAFVIGGPQGDAGLTGRKIIVDTYGGWGAHGGGAFSGKDFTKVDRSAAYASRWVAKSLVKSGICRRCLVQVSYAIGVAEPLSITVFDYGTSNLKQQQLLAIVKNNFDLRPGKIVKWDLSECAAIE